MIKAAFFDIDGTLVSFKTHTVPASARRALHRLHDAGVKLFIATGRSSNALPDVTTSSAMRFLSTVCSPSTVSTVT